MRNSTISNYRAGLNGWLILIVVLVSLNALGDLALFFWILGQPPTNASGIISLDMYFVHISANRTLFLIATPISFVSSVLLLVFIGIRRLFLFKLSFFITCIVSLGHLLINAITIHQFVYFDIPTPLLRTGENPIADMLIMPFKLLQNTTSFFVFSGISMAISIFVVCMVYFTRSKKIALYFNDSQT